MRRFHVNLLKPAKLMDPSQAYFWTQEWQEGEREAQEDIRKGRITGFKSVKKLMRDLRGCCRSYARSGPEGFPAAAGGCNYRVTFEYCEGE